MPRLDDAPDDELGEVGGRGRGLDDRRHAGEQRRRQLLEHAPDREIERIDVHRRAFERHADVLADESCRPSTAPRPRRRGRRGCSAARACPCSQRRTACRCRRRCRSSESFLVAPVRVRERVELVLVLDQVLAEALAAAPRARETSSRAAPVRRRRAHESSTARKSMPAVVASRDDRTGRCVAQRRRRPSPVRHAPLT